MRFKSLEEHRATIKKIQEQLQGKRQRFSLDKTNSNTLRNGDYKKKGKQLDISSLDGILEFNRDEGWIIVEPRMTFDRLLSATLPYALIPPVVPEFKSMTVGGAIMGAALESSSHRFGQVNDSCIEYECLLGDGTLMRASPLENADLFYGCTGSYGTLALLTAVKMRLIAATKWVQLELHTFTDTDDAIKFLTSPQSCDFIDGIVYKPAHTVAVAAKMSNDSAALPVLLQNMHWSSWYVQQIAKAKEDRFCMPLKDYLFRYDRGAFWMGQYANSFMTAVRLLLRWGIPSVKNGGFEPKFLFRLLFGWAFSSKRLYHFLHRIPTSIAQSLFLIHDFYLPAAKASEALKKFTQVTDIFPIWLCPVKRATTPQILSPHFGDSDFLNIGIYGIPQATCTTLELTTLLEKETLAYGGKKMLYSFTYFDPKSFSIAYGQDSYLELRKKYRAENAFPSLYEKVIAQPVRL